jgi:hypothetical protein
MWKEDNSKISKNKIKLREHTSKITNLPTNPIFKIVCLLDFMIGSLFVFNSGG